MKRLTDKRFLSDGYYQPKSKEEHKEIQMMEKPPYKEIYQKLGELETKMEKGELTEVTHGRWLVTGLFDDFAKCSVCGNDDHTLTAVYGGYGGSCYNYCPHCGAKMDLKRMLPSE